MAVSVGLVKLHTCKIRSNIESSTDYCRNYTFIRSSCCPAQLRLLTVCSNVQMDRSTSFLLFLIVHVCECSCTFYTVRTKVRMFTCSIGTSVSGPQDLKLGLKARVCFKLKVQIRK